MIRVALRSLVGRSRSLVGTALAIVVGVAFITGTSVLTGTIRTTMSALLDSSYRHIDVTVQGEGDDNIRAPLPASMLATVRSVKGVAEAQPFVSTPAQAAGKNGVRVPTPLGLSTLVASAPNYPDLAARVVAAGRWPSKDGEATIDKVIATKGNLGIGDTLRVSTGAATRALTIVGTSGLSDGTPSGPLDQRITVTLADAQKMANTPNAYQRIDIVSSGPRQVTLARAVAKAVGSNASVQTGEEFIQSEQGSTADAVNGLADALNPFGWVALGVASFVIANTFSILLAMRQRELALLRALGASRRHIITASVTEAGVVGAVSGVIGIAVGWLLALIPMRLVSTILPLPSVPPLSARTIATSMAIAIGVTCLAALLPAVRASRVPPVAAMRAAPDIASPLRRRAIVGAVLSVLGAAAITAVAALRPENFRGQLLALSAAILLAGLTVASPAIVSPFAAILGRVVQHISLVAGRLGVANTTRAPRRTATTASALMVGVTVVTAATVMALSLRGAFTSTLVNRLKADLVIDANNPTRGGLNPAVFQRVQAVRGLKAATPVRFAPGKMSRKPAAVAFPPTTAPPKGSAVAGPESEADKPGSDDHRAFILGVYTPDVAQLIDLGEIKGDLASMGTNDVAVTADFADEHHLHVGSRLAVQAVGSAATDMRVGAVMEKGPFGNRGIVISLGAFDAHVLPALRNDAYIYVKADGSVGLPALRMELKAATKDQVGAQVLTPREFAGIRLQRVDATLALVFGLLGLTVLVAAIGIWNTLGLSVVERRNELARTRAIGATRAQIRRSVGWEALTIALMGSALGLAAGYVVGRSLLPSLRAFAVTPVAPIWVMATILVVGVLVGLLAAAAPARRAAKVPMTAGYGVD